MILIAFIFQFDSLADMKVPTVSGFDRCEPVKSRKQFFVTVLHWLAVCGLFCLFAVAAVHLLRVTYCVFTSMNRTTNVDYTRYLNVMWNTAHGHWFQSGIDGSYLFFHLSFSLLPWAFIFRMTDHPFALATMQWFWVVSGGLLAAWAAKKKGVPQVAVGGLLVFWIGYHFAQSGVVHEFHGAMLYYLLVPWFYLWREKRLGWVPFCLLLGVREDAGLVIIPIVLYFAIRDQWKMGYVYAGVALAYVAVAVFVLYPLINGHSLFQIRTQELNGAVGGAAIRPRLLALFWALLPIIPLWRRGWLPLVAFVSLPLGMALASGYRFQYSLQVHYGGTVHICLALAWIEAWRLTVAKKTRVWWPGAAAAYFVIITLISNGLYGYLPGFRLNPVGRQYLKARPSGEYMTYLARKVLPRDGILAASPNCAAYVAARVGFMFPESFSYLESAKVAHRAEMVFTTLDNIPDPFVQALRQGVWGVWFFDDRYVVIKRGYKIEGNANLLKHLDGRSLAIAYTAPVAGKNTWTPEFGVVRIWSNKRQAAGSTVVATAMFKNCHKGRYQLVLSYGAKGSADGASPLRMRLFICEAGARREQLVEDIPSTTPGMLGEHACDVVFNDNGRLEVTIEATSGPVVLRTLLLSDS